MAATWWTGSSVPAAKALAGRIAIVTGSSNGIGVHTASLLADLGAHVVVAVRSVDKGEKAAADIRSHVPAASLEVRQLDVGDIASIDAFAADLPHDKVHILVNNAGIFLPPHQLRLADLESQAAVNYAGPFRLTAKLWGRLSAAAEGGEGVRIVNVSSMFAQQGNAADLASDAAFFTPSEASYDALQAYKNSKAAQVLFSHELASRVAKSGKQAWVDNIRVVSSHPGLSSTNLSSSSSKEGQSSFAKTIAGGQPAHQGSWPSVLAAVDAAAQGGDMYGPREGMQGEPIKANEHKPAFGGDDSAAADLWKRTEKLVGEFSL